MFWEKWKACWESMCQCQFTASTRIQLVMFWPLCLLGVYTVSLAFQDRPNIICQWATWRYFLTVLSLLFSFDRWCYWGWENILVVTERVCWQCLGLKDSTQEHQGSEFKYLLWWDTFSRVWGQLIFYTVEITNYHIISWHFQYRGYMLQMIWAVCQLP